MSTSPTLPDLSLLAGRMWARVIAVLTAVLSALVNVAFIAAFLIWTVMMHGREMTSDY
jgi:hypothetical protein